MEKIFKSEVEVTDNWVNFLALEAAALSENSDEYIDRYMNRQLDNPQLKEYLDEESTDTILSAFDDEENEPLNLNLTETLLFTPKFRIRLPKFRRLKRAIRKVFCEVITAHVDGDIKDIIKSVLIGLIPVLGGGGIAPILLPIIIGYIAKLVKKGSDAVCG